MSLQKLWNISNLLGINSPPQHPTITTSCLLMHYTNSPLHVLFMIFFFNNMSRSNKEFVSIRYSVDVYINYAVEDNNIFMLSHSKNVFVTLTYYLSFEMRHNSRCSVTFYTQNPYTHQWLQSHNYYRLPCYYSGNRVMWYVHVDKYRLLLI